MYVIFERRAVLGFAYDEIATPFYDSLFVGWALPNGGGTDCLGFRIVVVHEETKQDK